MLFAVTALFATLPFHEYGHCIFDWMRGSQSACTVAYYHPASDQPPTWACTEQDRIGPSGQPEGRVLVCHDNLTAQLSDTKAFQQGGGVAWYEDPILYGAQGVVVTMAALTGLSVKTWLPSRQATDPAERLLSTDAYKAGDTALASKAPKEAPNTPEPRWLDHEPHLAKAPDLGDSDHGLPDPARWVGPG